MNQAGLTVVELLIALLISLLITLAAINVFLANNQSYRLHEAASRAQENSRFAILKLQREARMAGYTGCAGELFNWLNTAASGYVASLMSLHAVSGWEADGSGPGDTLDLSSGPAPSANWVNGIGDPLPSGVDPMPGTDVVAINRAVELSASLSGNPGGPANVLRLGNGADEFNSGDIVAAVLHDCSGGELWQVDNATNHGRLVKNGGNSGPGNHPAAGHAFRFAHDDQSSLYAWENRIFFVRVNTSTGEPGLYVRRLVGSGSSRVDEIVEGVEQLQVVYGIDTEGDGYPDRYATAASVNDWETVVSVRLGLLLRSAPGATRKSNTQRRYNLLGTEFIAPDDTRLRRVATTTVAIRNRPE